MTIPSLPEEQRPVVEEQDEVAYPSQRLMTVLSIVMVAALILGSATTVFYLTDWGLNVAGLIGMVMAVLLVVVWFRMPRRG
jgi:hypothetical protein